MKTSNSAPLENLEVCKEQIAMPPFFSLFFSSLGEELSHINSVKSKAGVD